MEKLIKRKSIFLVLLTALLFLTSCVQSVSGSSTQTASDNDESKVLFKGSINLESSLARSASPVAIDMTSHEFYVIATPKNGEAFEVEVDQTERTFEMLLPCGSLSSTENETPRSIKALSKLTSAGQKSS